MAVFATLVLAWVICDVRQEMKSLLLLLIAVWLPWQTYAEDASKKVISVAVIAPSVSTSMMAQKIIAEKNGSKRIQRQQIFS